MTTAERTNTQRETERTTACYVYGIVPSDVVTDPEARGVGDPPAPIDLVRHEDIAALISEIPRDKPLGLPEHFHSHKQLLDAAAESPVLPFRFGSVLVDKQSVIEDLLAPYHDEFVTALGEVEGKVEFIVRARYVEDVLLRELLSENDEAARLRDQIRGKPEDATRNERIALGELINEAVMVKRDADTAAMVDALTPLSVAVSVREPSHEQDAANIAFLIEADREQEFRDAVEELARAGQGRITVRLLGPLAPYDFITSRTTPEG